MKLSVCLFGAEQIPVRASPVPSVVASIGAPVGDSPANIQLVQRLVVPIGAPIGGPISALSAADRAGPEPCSF